MIRQPAVAGQFYPSERKQLLQQVEALLKQDAAVQQVIAAIAPHAGYSYSGAIAGELFASIEIPRLVILLGPNHHGAGAAIALSGAQAWATPLGEVPLAGKLREALLTAIDPLVIDDQAHSFEHSLEVMLPFLQKRRNDLEIVPISLGRLNLADCLMLGHGLAQVVSSWDEDVLLLASSDMNHFDSATATEKLDTMAIEAMTALDPERLYRVVREQQISMCGVLPVVAVMQTARLLGAQECHLLQHAHSGMVNGDDSRVVGYAGLTVV